MIAVIASICLGTSCQWVTVTTSDQDPNVNLMSCQMLAPAPLAEWLGREWPGYRLAEWRCIVGAKRNSA